MIGVREWIGLGIVRVGQQIVRFGDWVAGWGKMDAFAMGMRIGARLALEGERKRAFTRERRKLPGEW